MTTVYNKNGIAFDIDAIATDLNGKADVDLTNVTDTGYIKMADASMPSSRYIDLTFGADGSTYTAPADGWVIFQSGINSGGYLGLRNLTTNVCSEVRYSQPTNGRTFAPFSKGDVIQIGYENLLTTERLFRFIYALGSESEA